MKRIMISDLGNRSGVSGSVSDQKSGSLSLSIRHVTLKYCAVPISDRSSTVRTLPTCAFSGVLHAQHLLFTRIMHSPVATLHASTEHIPAEIAARDICRAFQPSNAVLVLKSSKVSTNGDLFDPDDHNEPGTGNAKNLAGERGCTQGQGTHVAWQGHRGAPAAPFR